MLIGSRGFWKYFVEYGTLITVSRAKLKQDDSTFAVVTDGLWADRNSIRAKLTMPTAKDWELPELEGDSVKANQFSDKQGQSVHLCKVNPVEINLDSWACIGAMEA